MPQTQALLVSSLSREEASAFDCSFSLVAVSVFAPRSDIQPFPIRDIDAARRSFLYFRLETSPPCWRCAEHAEDRSGRRWYLSAQLVLARVRHHAQPVSDRRRTSGAGA